jgi:hypothetical protein
VKIKQLRWIWGGLCMVLIGALTAAAPWGSSAEQGQNASPNAGAPGQRFAFYATGFKAGETVGTWATAPDGTVLRSSGNEVTANKNGRADWIWTAPQNAASGTWLIVAQGTKSKVLRTLRIEIAGGSSGQPAPPSAGQVETTGQNVAPRSGGPSTRFSFYATGFKPGERVGFWATAPDGSTPAQRDRQVVANSFGRADWAWSAPGDAAAGEWVISAQGVTSGQYRTLRIVVVR